MSEENSTLPALLSQIESAKRRAVYSLLPLLLALLAGAGVLVYTYFEVNALLERKNELEKNIDTLRKEKTDLEGANKAAGRTLDEQKEKIEKQKEAIAEGEMQIASLRGTLLKVREQSPNEEILKTIDANPYLASRVYIHIYDESQRAMARTVTSALEKARYKVLGVERVDAKLKATEVRFFHEEDRTAAVDVSKKLQEQGVPNEPVGPIKLKAKPGSIEIWFAAP